MSQKTLRLCLNATPHNLQQIAMQVITSSTCIRSAHKFKYTLARTYVHMHKRGIAHAHAHMYVHAHTHNTYTCPQMHINTYTPAEKPAEGWLLCHGAPSTVLLRWCSYNIMVLPQCCFWRSNDCTSDGNWSPNLWSTKADHIESRNRKLDHVDRH